MRAQLELVLTRMRLGNVTVQVIPFSTGAHPAIDSTFNILEFDGVARDVVYSEGMAGLIFMERSEDVARYNDVFEQLSDIALTPTRSGDLIQKISEGYEATLKVAG